MMILLGLKKKRVKPAFRILNTGPLGEGPAPGQKAVEQGGAKRFPLFFRLIIP